MACVRLACSVCHLSLERLVSGRFNDPSSTGRCGAARLTTAALANSPSTRCVLPCTLRSIWPGGKAGRVRGLIVRGILGSHRTLRCARIAPCSGIVPIRGGFAEARLRFWRGGFGRSDSGAGAAAMRDSGNARDLGGGCCRIGGGGAAEQDALAVTSKGHAWVDDSTRYLLDEGGGVSSGDIDGAARERYVRGTVSASTHSSAGAEAKQIRTSSASSNGEVLECAASARNVGIL